MSQPRTTVHLLRHGEVYNPDGILYGRRDGFHLSDRGQRMAQRIAESIGDRDIVHMRSSPLERAQETAAPLADELGLEVALDPRVIESGNKFEGEKFGSGARALMNPKHWPLLWNPMRPSWGEPYKEVADRMMAAVSDAREAAVGHEAVVVSHQLPIWIARLAAQNRRFMHDPRSRQCTLCSLTSLHFVGAKLSQLSYSEPAGDMIPAADRGDVFSSGGARDSDNSDGATKA